MASLPEEGAAVTPLRIASAEPAGLAQLLRFEGDVRRQQSVDELVYFAANESRALIGFDQLFLLRRSLLREGFSVIAASSIALVDRNAPLIQAIEHAAQKFGETPETVVASDASDDSAIGEYPFHQWYWAPLADRQGVIFAGFLAARSVPWTEADAVRISRIAETVGHSWLALTAGKPVRRLPRLNNRTKKWSAAALIIAALFPVRMTALAPVEVVPAKPFIVSAPYTGVIASVDVAPNTLVKAGQPVVTFEDIKVRNELQQAQERMQVARAKVERATSASFADKDQAREIGPLRAELELAQADYAYARDMMGKSQIITPRSGMAIYSDRRDWEGRAVNVGDPILQIADPKDYAYRIELPSKEQMALEPGAPVKIWLDAQPLWALNGQVEHASYIAQPTADGILAFAVTAKPNGGRPRIGSRGTAKLYGQWAPLSYSLLRRPIASLRQFFGI
jgi:multidrug resistance efflux pump